jgi:hypothetical protein
MNTSSANRKITVQVRDGKDKRIARSRKRPLETLKSAFSVQKGERNFFAAATVESTFR